MQSARECPRCGTEKLEVIEICGWKENALEVTIHCWNCNVDVPGKIHGIPEQLDMTCVACSKDHRPIGRDKTRLCEECSHKLISFDCSFGIVIPQNSGVVFKNQTGGMMCSRRYVEGVKIRFRNHRFNDLMKELADANYRARDNVSEVWDKIDEKLWFDYERVEAPENQMSNTEAFQWIKITGVDKDQQGLYVNREELIGETVVMHYKNCD